MNESGLFRAIGAVNEAIGATDWVRVAPYGEWPNEVGMQVFDSTAAEAITTAFNTAASKAANLWRGLPIYEGHPDEPEWQRRNPGYKKVAVGRVKELQPRSDGLYARVAFNDRGNPLVRGDAPAYEAQSPRWGMAKIRHQGRDAFRPMELYSLGLTNTPNIPGTQLGINDRTESLCEMKPEIIALLAALGRPVANADTVTDAQLQAAVNEAVTTAKAATAAVNELVTVKTKLVTAENECSVTKAKLATSEQNLAAEKASAINERNARIETVLTTAVNSGRITQAQRDGWKTKLVAAVAINDFAVVETEIGKLQPAANTRGHVKDLGKRKPEELAEAATRINAINEAVAAEKKATPGISHFDAYQSVRRKKPDLFVNAAE